jgi:hypothetical protein
MGYESKAIVREYTFLVKEAEIEPFEITLTIPHGVFTSRRLSFQNAPDICSLKLHRELADAANSPLKAHYQISENDVNAYCESHPSSAPKGLYPKKVAQHA